MIPPYSTEKLGKKTDGQRSSHYTPNKTYSQSPKFKTEFKNGITEDGWHSNYCAHPRLGVCILPGL